MSINIFYNNLKFFIKRNSDFCSQYFLLLATIIFTPYLICIDYINNIYVSIFNFSQAVIKGNYFVTFFIDFAIGVIPLLFIFLFGLSLFGFAVSYLNVAFIGTFISNAISYYYINFSIEGFRYCISSVIPKVLIYLIVFLFGSRESYIFSRMISKSFNPGKRYNFYQDFKIYCLRFLVLTIVILVTSIFSVLKIYFLK